MATHQCISRRSHYNVAKVLKHATYFAYTCLMDSPEELPLDDVFFRKLSSR